LRKFEVGANIIVLTWLDGAREEEQAGHDHHVRVNVSAT
jgi:hypothetical protein